jgi:hypothetical protein
MPRMRIPIVEVIAPDGTKSLWAAIAIPHGEAVAAVKKRIPKSHTAELSVRKFPSGTNLNGARPGDVIQIDLIY